MPIQHKFYQTNFGNGFETHSAILDGTPYDPEVLIIGTFNPNTNGQHNLANFFYGRDNYLIPLIHGIFNLQTTYNQLPPYNDILWPLCNKLKLSFADLITTVFPANNNALLPNTNKLVVNGITYNLLKDLHLISIDSLGQIIWNVESIANYINNTPSIKYVMLTQKSDTVFRDKFMEIKKLCANNRISFRSIYTPTGQSLSGKPRDLFLAIQWLIEQDNNEQLPSGFDINWLHSHNVNSFNHGNYNLLF